MNTNIGSNLKEVLEQAKKAENPKLRLAYISHILGTFHSRWLYLNDPNSYLAIHCLAPAYNRLSEIIGKTEDIQVRGLAGQKFEKIMEIIEKTIKIIEEGDATLEKLAKLYVEELIPVERDLIILARSLE